jgi:hypothetical protein
MSEWGDIISRIFSSGRTQGLSGSAEAILDPDPASSFYASRLRKHITDGDMVESPELLWSSSSYGGRKGGLLFHMQHEQAMAGDRATSFTDILFVINRSDASRAASALEPWAEAAGRCIGQLFEQSNREFQLPFSDRSLRFWFVGDGSKEMLGQSFGLDPGEYVTGLLPNLYIGPSAVSRPILAVHLNLPGVWQGYKEVGRLYHDQLLFTVGRHWLDNFHHPALREPGLYRLQQFSNGSLVHEVSPELQDRYLVRSDKVDEASVITVAERQGKPVAFVVLAALESEAPVAASKPFVPEGALTVPISLTNAITRDSHTIVPSEIGARMLTLQERGALLQKVHFAAFMEGYDIYIGSNGQMATMLNNPNATIQIRGRRIMLLSQSGNVRVGGRKIENGILIPLSGEMDIEVDGHPFHYHDLTEVQCEGWPYLAEIRRPGSGTYLEFGGAARIGRDRRCKVRLPDEPHNDNISWLPLVDNGTTIRSRNGDIPKSRFYTDSIMVASEHLELDLSHEPIARSMARNCYSFIRRAGRVISLAPREAAEGTKELLLQQGDELLVGNCLFQLSWPPSEGRSEARQLTEKPPTFLTGPELPSAAGLGERGTAPRPLQLDTLAQDSITTPLSSPRFQKTQPFPEPPALPMLLPDTEDPVIAMEPGWCAAELAQPARLILMGWVLGPENIIGNARDATIIIPELRYLPDQAFMTLEYFKILISGTPVIEHLQPGESRLLEDGVEVEQTSAPLKARLHILRRNADFDPDFELSFLVGSTGLLPGGRAWLLKVDMTQARSGDLFTVGLKAGVRRRIRLGNIDMSLLFANDSLTISDYAQDRPAEGFVLASGNSRHPMSHFPQDGRPVVLNNGNWLLVGNQLYSLQGGG